MAQKTVTTFAELKSAIEDSTTTEILLAKDIVFSSGGIQIPKTKGNISIDGAGHTITDYNSGAYTDTIYFSPSAGTAVTATMKTPYGTAGTITESSACMTAPTITMSRRF